MIGTSDDDSVRMHQELASPMKLSTFHSAGITKKALAITMGLAGLLALVCALMSQSLAPRMAEVEAVEDVESLVAIHWDGTTTLPRPTVQKLVNAWVNWDPTKANNFYKYASPDICYTIMGPVETGGIVKAGSATTVCGLDKYKAIAQADVEKKESKPKNKHGKRKAPYVSVVGNTIKLVEDWNGDPHQGKDIVVMVMGAGSKVTNIFFNHHHHR